MAKYIVPPRKKRDPLIRCFVCKTLYMPESKQYGHYEKCPVCGTDMNDKHNEIPLWAYNLIKYWRGLFEHGHQGNQRRNQEQCERAGSGEGAGSER